MHAIVPSTHTVQARSHTVQNTLPVPVRREKILFILEIATIFSETKTGLIPTMYSVQGLYAGPRFDSTTQPISNVRISKTVHCRNGSRTGRVIKKLRTDPSFSEVTSLW